MLVTIDKEDLYSDDFSFYSNYDYSHSNSIDNNNNNYYYYNNYTDGNISTTPERENAGVWIVKGVGSINNKKNIVLPPRHFITPTHNAYTALAKNNNTDDNDDNNLNTPVSVLKQK